MRMAFLILGYCIDNELKKIAVMVDCPSRYASQQVSKSASQQVSMLPIALAMLTLFGKVDKCLSIHAVA